MAEIRKLTVDVLKAKVGEKTAGAYEKEIYKMCVETWDGKPDMKDKRFVAHLTEIEYEKLGALMSSNCKEDRKVILDDMKSGKYGWDASHFLSERDEIESEIIRLSKPMEVAEGVFKCRKCGGQKTTSIGVQLRGADEPMTNFVTCVTCKNKWKC